MTMVCGHTKPGYKPSTYLDNDQKPIYDPELANRDSGGTLNYKDFCGYLCVPRSRKKEDDENVS